jgi:plastocyanin
MRVPRFALLFAIAPLTGLWTDGWPPSEARAAQFAAQSQQDQPGVVTIAIFDNHFQPKRITIPVGTTVVWVNHGKRAQTVTSRGGLWQDSGVLAPGDSWSVTFDLPGTFFYLSRSRDAKGRMVGQIVVRK